MRGKKKREKNYLWEGRKKKRIPVIKLVVYLSMDHLTSQWSGKYPCYLSKRTFPSFSKLLWIALGKYKNFTKSVLQMWNPPFKKLNLNLTMWSLFQRSSLWKENFEGEIKKIYGCVYHSVYKNWLWWKNSITC